MTIDGAAGTGIYRFSGDLNEVAFLKSDVTAIAYALPGLENGAVIGVGGGRDVLTALLFGLKTVVGVELNPIFGQLLLRDYADFTALARHPGVTIEVDEARSWFSRTTHSFDIIQMSLIDTWAATGAGAFTLSENGLYTVEGW
jgi:spermidine synthase